MWEILFCLNIGKSYMKCRVFNLFLSGVRVINCKCKKKMKNKKKVKNTKKKANKTKKI